MYRYVVEYVNREDELAEHHRYYIIAYDVNDAVKRFRYMSPKQESQITEIARVIEKNFSKM